MNELKLLLQNRKSLYITLGLSLIYIIPLLISDHEYLDDWGRNLYGYGWQHDGRFIATLLGKIWSLNSSIFSIYPFSLLLSAIILGFTGFLLVSIFNIEKENTIKWAPLLIVTSPAFLGNLVFKFDCLPMALSLFVVVFPFIFYHKKQKFILLSLIGVFLSLGLYQSSTTVFFIIGSLFLIREIKNWQWKLFFKDFGILAGVFIIAFIAYSLLIGLFNLPVSNRTETILFQPNVFELLSKNYDIFTQRINSILKSGSYVFIIISFLIICLTGFIINFISYKEKSRLIIIIPSILLIVFVDFLLISSVNILLKESYWDLRTFCGLGFFLLVCLSFQTGLKGVLLKTGRWLTFVLIAFSFVLMAQFGRILNNQSQFQNAIGYELNHYFKDESIKNLGFIGTLRIAPRNEFTYHKFPVFQLLLGSPIGQYSAWSMNILNANGMLEGVNIIPTENLLCKGMLIEKTRFYYVREIDEETLIIDFTKCE
ncbi:MAG TPA: glucosyltransferase domain-containing protein [Flavobacterium sp.]|nr:glucosyltransferase domain-containing protein [Flavobacterium sp.]